MNEDFGDYGDEAFLDEHNFCFELNEMRAMEYEEQQEVLRELAQKEEDERQQEADLQAECNAEARWEGVYPDSGEWDDDPNPYSGTYSEE